MAIVRLAAKSLWNRRFTAALTLISIALSVALLLGVERLRTESRESFANTISGTDLIVGARSGSTQLLLYSVFRIGNATNNISWQSFQELAHHRNVKWAVPISLGDSHRGFRVMGTTADYFNHYRFARERTLDFRQGTPFSEVYDAVLGAEVAEQLGYRLGEKIVIAHGAGRVNLVSHDDKPFTVTGILARTGTPLDRTIHVPLAGIEAIHIDWQGGSRTPGLPISAERALKHDLTPKSITAAYLGLTSRISTFKVQRYINDYKKEPLLAIIPGVALQQLWDMMGVAERVLLAVSAFVVLVGLTGMVTVILTSLNERRREMAILRSVGARPSQITLLIIGEALTLTLLGTLLGLALLYGLLEIAQPLIESHFGLFIPVDWPSSYELVLLGTVQLVGFVIALLPAWRAYRYSVADGMTIRI
ncbi:peptide ABC transporter permease [Solemya pervernicosa gill symbiont]|uniref:Peptide ABC transporter permease n=1 Tax=Solemya pervernicosa gill symbiont TaxID=642797 RepID=A0A1T2L7C7_9GAMM|nr:ABC transporter permease [Solemya pervernicosa gill symbiont]OOZ41007.1 peptide ABC transporter permease [Solemya pervernicosa gill symbiont]